MTEEEQKFLLLFTRTLDKIIQEATVDPDWEGNQSLLNTWERMSPSLKE